MRIGELAAATGVSRDALRFYEKRGLIHSTRRSNNYREYPDEMAQIVGYIRVALGLGFGLAEIGEHLPALWGKPAANDEIARLLRQKIAVIEQRIASLVALRDELTTRVDAICPLRA